MLLTVKNLCKEFDGLHAVNSVNFSVELGTITGLIGPNGAGKTTTFNIIAGHDSPTSGAVFFGKQEISGMKPYETFHLGIVRTFQIPRPFSGMTVLENMMMVPGSQLGENLWNNWIRLKQVKRQEATNREKALEILEFLKLEALRDEPSMHLSGGQLKLLELGRAMMSKPRMILLDEPAAGVNPVLLEEIIDRIREINEMGVTFLIIEHNMDLIMKLCSPILVMAEGSIMMQGSPEQVRSDKRLLDAFFGE